MGDQVVRVVPGPAGPVPVADTTVPTSEPTVEVGLCRACEWIPVGTLGQPDQVMLGRPCPAHTPAPPRDPLAEAQAELDDIDRATGLDRLPGWRPIFGQRRPRILHHGYPGDVDELLAIVLDNKAWAKVTADERALREFVDRCDRTVLRPGVRWTSSRGPR